MNPNSFRIRDSRYVRAAETIDAGMPGTPAGRAVLAVTAAGIGFVLSILVPQLLGGVLLALIALDMRRHVDRWSLEYECSRREDRLRAGRGTEAF
ncbi:hypothetical protein SAMN05421678_106262 [Actinopolymorpha cephalotaxi]|uniref:Uncharacterized protein n=1 Tax=Actinopolymorpha cephalotaxi TaxID=504797 RepID=A0A1I2SNN5_9ACTN|nr:hypothetical protein [Actinopolymorpha cephalotaxi]NYH84011.1 hypothetical protein [Actinopolymorpha cephalotaxi]SFG53329.1 hypothetical protein SAMN05421678_106262 [Actinopolymorpha cephalotaxi]